MMIIQNSVLVIRSKDIYYIYNVCVVIVMIIIKIYMLIYIYIEDKYLKKNA